MSILFTRGTKEVARVNISKKALLTLSIDDLDQFSGSMPSLRFIETGILNRIGQKEFKMSLPKPRENC